MALQTDMQTTKILSPDYLHPYYPYSSGKRDCASRRIIKFKEGDRAALRHYTLRLDEHLDKDAVLATVPSHKPSNVGSIDRAAQILAQKHERVDATGCLVRHRKIRKLSQGGHRHVQVHLTSIKVENKHLVTGKQVTLLDDVTTTGNSFRACRQLLLDAGAASVHCLALSKTMR